MEASSDSFLSLSQVEHISYHSYPPAYVVVKLIEYVAVGVSIQGPYSPLSPVSTVTVWVVLGARLDEGSTVTIR